MWPVLSQYHSDIAGEFHWCWSSHTGSLTGVEGFTTWTLRWENCQNEGWRGWNFWHLLLGLINCLVIWVVLSLDNLILITSPYLPFPMGKQERKMALKFSWVLVVLEQALIICLMATNNPGHILTCNSNAAYKRNGYNLMSPVFELDEWQCIHQGGEHHQQLPGGLKG